MFEKLIPTNTVHSFYLILNFSVVKKPDFVLNKYVKVVIICDTFYYLNIYISLLYVGQKVLNNKLDYTENT